MHPCNTASLLAQAKRPKAKKDPNAPKRPLTAYMLWLNANRDQIKVGLPPSRSFVMFFVKYVAYLPQSDNPGIKITEIAKKGGEVRFT